MWWLEKGLIAIQRLLSWVETTLVAMVWRLYGDDWETRERY